MVNGNVLTIMNVFTQEKNTEQKLNATDIMM